MTKREIEEKIVVEIEELRHQLKVNGMHYETVICGEFFSTFFSLN